jgi:hypothetical protein
MMAHVAVALFQVISTPPCIHIAGRYAQSNGFVGEAVVIAPDCSFEYRYGTDNFVRVKSSGSAELTADTLILRAEAVVATRLTVKDGKTVTETDEDLVRSYRNLEFVVVQWGPQRLLAHPSARKRLCAALRSRVPPEVQSWALVDVAHLNDPYPTETPRWCEERR